MWINVPEHLKEIKHPEMDGPEHLGDGESAQVSKEIGDLLVEECDGIERKSEEDKSE